MAKQKSGGQRGELSGLDLFTSLSDNVFAPMLESYVDERGGDSTRMATYRDRERRQKAQEAADEQRRKIELENLQAKNKRRLEKRTLANKDQELRLQTASDIRKNVAEKLTDVEIARYNDAYESYNAASEFMSPEEMEAAGIERPQLDMSFLQQITAVDRGTLTPRGKNRIDRLEKAAKQADNIRDVDEKSRVNVALSEELDDIQRKEVAEMPNVETESAARISPIGENGAYRVLQPNGRLEIQHDNNLPKVAAATESEPTKKVDSGFISTAPAMLSAPPQMTEAERERQRLTTPQYEPMQENAGPQMGPTRLEYAADRLRSKGRATAAEQAALSQYDMTGNIAKFNKSVERAPALYSLYEQVREGERFAGYLSRMHPDAVNAHRDRIRKEYKDAGKNVSEKVINYKLRAEQEAEYARQHNDYLSEPVSVLALLQTQKAEELEALRDKAIATIRDNRKRTVYSPMAMKQEVNEDGTPKLDDDGKPILTPVGGNFLRPSDEIAPYTEEEIRAEMLKILQNRIDFETDVRQLDKKNKAAARRAYHEGIASRDPDYANAIEKYDEDTGAPIFKDMMPQVAMTKEAQKTLLDGLLSKKYLEGQASTSSVGSAAKREPINMTPQGPLAKKYESEPEKIGFANQAYNAIAYPTLKGFSENIDAYKKARKKAGLDDFTSSQYESESVAAEIDELLLANLYDESNPDKDEALQEAISKSLASMTKALNEGKQDHITLLPDDVKRGLYDLHWLSGNADEDMAWLQLQIESGRGGEYYFTQDGFLKQINNPLEQTQPMKPRDVEALVDDVTENPQLYRGMDIGGGGVVPPRETPKARARREDTEARFLGGAF